jgi:hypothetical protein
VAIDTRLLAVARRAEPWIGARLVGMTREEAGAVKAGEAYVIEG